MSTADERPLAGDVPLWEVPGWRERWGVLAGITGRGGDPAAPFDLGLWSGQPVGEVMGRWRRFRQGFPKFPTQVMAHQVHGNRLLWHDRPSVGWTVMDGADGHATAAPGTLLLVTVADCIPVYLIAPAQRAIALVHAGWRGTSAGILARGVDALQEHAGAATSGIVMHAGVGICGSCYEVGSQVMTGVGRAAEGPGPWQLDLRTVLAEQARELRLTDITVSRLCTACRRDEFFSHRRSGGVDGRMVAFLGIPAS